MKSKFTWDEDWFGCYNTRRRVSPCAESSKHPARMSEKLVVKIIKYLKNMGEIESDSIVLDPFTGVGTTNIVCSLNGIPSYGIELEETYADIAAKNLEGLGGRYRVLCGDEFIVCGDSSVILKDND